MSWNRGSLTTAGVRWYDNGSDGLRVDDSNQPFSTGTPFHIVMTQAPADAESTRVTWYRVPATTAALGGRRGQSTVSKTLADLNDTRKPLGRSLNGSASDEVAHAAGPDSVPVLPGIPATSTPSPVLAGLSVAPGAIFALPAGLLQIQTVTKQDRVRLSGDADLRVPGSFNNSGISTRFVGATRSRRRGSDRAPSSTPRRFG